MDERYYNAYTETIYAHFFKEDGKIIIQYWFFYPFNDGFNNHEGDWEHINVHLSSQNPALASIIEIDYYFHHKVKTVSTGYYIEDSTHPIVYVGGSCAGITPPESCRPSNNTGGSYPWPGRWNNIGQWGYDEYVWGDGPTIHHWLFINSKPDRGIVILPEPDRIDYNEHPEMSWLKADVAWGHLAAESPYEVFGSLAGNSAPCGPYHNIGWNETGPVEKDGKKYENYPGGPQ